MSHAGLVNAVFTTVGVALVSTAVVAARAGNPPSPSRTALTGAVATLGGSFLVQSPMARGVQDQLVVNLGQLTGNGTTLIAAYALRIMVLHILYDRDTATARARRWLVALVVVLGAMTALFLATPTAPSRFTSPDAPGGVVAYYVIFTGYLGATLLSLSLLLGRYVERTAGRASRLSLHLQRGACAAGLIYLAGRLTALIIGRLGLDVTGERFGLIEFVVTAVVPGFGVALSLLAVLVRGGDRWRRHRRAYRRLRPLWEAARVARPHAVLPLTGGGARLRLYRRVIEIQDAQFAAGQAVDAAQRRQIDEAIAESALTGETAEAVREAALLASGLAALRGASTTTAGPAALRADPTATAGPAALRADPTTTGPAVNRPAEETDLAAVVARLERVGAAWTGSPVVRRFAGPPSPAHPR